MKKNKFKQIFDETYLKKGGYKWKQKKVFKFTWDYCGLCEIMFVRCPKCGNNCCNAGFGEVDENGLPTKSLADRGVTCDVCNLAYQYQHLSHQTKTAPKPTKADLKKGKEQVNKNEAQMNKIFGQGR